MISKTTYQNYFDKSSCVDCLIWGYGHEQRNSLQVLSDWKNKTKNANIVIFTASEDKEILVDYLNLSNLNHKVLIIEFDNFGELEDKNLTEFVSYFDNQNSNFKITIDVTGISREHLLIILHLLRSSGKSNIQIVYISCEYGEYKVKNYSLPHNIKFFEGKPILGKPIVMILLAGYEKMACEVIINTYQPNLLFIGFSGTPIEKNQNLPERTKVNELVKNYTGTADMITKEFEYKADDFNETFKSISNLIEENSLNNNFNIILASCTSKLATVGMYLLHEKYPEAQCVYTVGKKEDLSKKVLNVFQKELPQRSSDL